MKKIFQFSFYMLMLAIVLVMIHSTGDVLAQGTNFDVPTLLPPEDTNLGGKGDACIGLASMIQSGDIHLKNLPCFIKFITQTLIGFAGSISVVFVMIGGYRYVIGTDEQKEAGKKTITYALVGLAISLMAWVIVDLVLQIATE